MVRPLQISVPRHLVLLAQALAPAIEILEKVIRDKADPIVTDHDLEDLVDSLQTWGMLVGRIDRCSDLLMTEIVERPDISESEIYRQVGRFEGQILDPLMADARPLQHPIQEALARPFSLWNEVRWHLLSQVLTWLHQIRDVLLHPETAYQTRDFSMEGEVAMFEIHLKLSVPPAMAQLQEWALKRTAEAKNEMNRSENLVESRSYAMSARDSTDDLGRTIVKLLSWILLVNVLDSD